MVAKEVAPSRPKVTALAEAQEWCKRYTKERASNFYYAFAILPADKRNAIYAAYAFSGMVDDIADELHDGEEQRRRLEEARASLHDCALRGPGEAADSELFTALGWAIQRFAIPLDYFEEL